MRTASPPFPVLSQVGRRRVTVALRRPNAASARLSSAQLSCIKGNVPFVRRLSPSHGGPPKYFFSLFAFPNGEKISTVGCPLRSAAGGWFPIPLPFRRQVLFTRPTPCENPHCPGSVGPSPVVCSDEKQCEVHIPAQNVCLASITSSVSASSWQE